MISANYFIWLFLLVLAIIAFIKNDKKISIFVISLIQLRIILPYFYVSRFVSDVVWENREVPVEQLTYKRGLFTVADFIERDNIFVLVGVIIIIILCVRGFKK